MSSSSSSSSLSEVPLKLTPEPQISVLIKRNDLKAARYNGLRKVPILGMRNPFFKRRRVFVEAAPNNTQDRVFYVPPVSSSARIKATPTQYITVNPARTRDLVRRSDTFEISFIGMSATPHDVALSNDNELLLYSLSRKGECDGPAPKKPVVRVPATSGDIVLAEHAPGVTELVSIQALNESERRQTVPSNISPCEDLPFIHYDPVIDGHDDGTEPDAFVPIPASKRKYRQYRNVQDSSDCRRNINVRFTLMEIDRISDLQARSISGVDRLGSYVSAAATGVPYMELLTKAFAVAANLGKDGLNAYSKPDHVLSVDIDFMLADDHVFEAASTDSEVGQSEEKIGNYLRVRSSTFSCRNRAKTFHSNARQRMKPCNDLGNEIIVMLSANT